MSSETYVRIPAAVHQGWQSWFATVGAVSEHGATKTKALANLAESISTGLRRWDPPALVQYAGVSAVVYFTPTGGLVYRVHVDGRESWAQITGDTIADGKRAALRSMVQRVTDWHDDAAVWAGADALIAADDDEGAAEHLRYAAWQRAAKVTQASGRADWHEEATRTAGDYTLVRAA